MSNPIPLVQGQIYHIYNRGNNRETIFREDRNYHYFLNLYSKYIPQVADTYAYCLLPNHFHFLVRIKSAEALFQNFYPNSDELDPEMLIKQTRRHPSQGFANLFISYTKSFNKVYSRTGSLLEKPFHRKHVASDLYFQQLVLYLNHNPQKHGLVDDFREWEYSSFYDLCSDQPTLLDRNTVIEVFGSLDTFKKRMTEYDPNIMDEEF